jgi:hypothetical protein
MTPISAAYWPWFEMQLPWGCSTCRPYSPELNPVGNVWEFLRHNDPSNRVYATYEAIVDARCIA